jgi:hypothetical protein
VTETREIGPVPALLPEVKLSGLVGTATDQHTCIHTKRQNMAKEEPRLAVPGWRVIVFPVE